MNPTLPPVLGSPEAEPHAPAPTRRNLLFKAGVALNAIGVLLLGLPLIGFVFSSFFHKNLGKDWISLGNSRQVSRERNQADCLPQPVHSSLGRRNRRHPLLRSPVARSEVQGVRGELRASRLSRPLVRGIRSLHVPLPWRRLLLGRLPRFRAHHRADSLNTTTKSRTAKCSSRAAKCPRSLIPFRIDTGTLMNTLRSIALWVDDRLHLTKLFESTAGHHVPASAGSWFYVFGSATLLCFVIQIITGTCLAFVYVPSTNEAWTSLQYLNQEQYPGLALARHPLLGLELHGRHHDAAHDPGIPVRRL